MRVGTGRLADMKARIEDFARAAAERPDDDSVWTTILWVAVDREGRPAPIEPAEPAAVE